MKGGGMSEALAPSDAALFRDPVWMQETMALFPVMFAQGLEGYTDDRLADGGGWVTFDVTTITCPVTILHGEMDRMCKRGQTPTTPLRSSRTRNSPSTKTWSLQHRDETNSNDQRSAGTLGGESGIPTCGSATVHYRSQVL